MFLVRRLLLCEELERSSCGSVLFHGYLPPPGTVAFTVLTLLANYFASLSNYKWEKLFLDSCISIL